MEKCYPDPIILGFTQGVRIDFENWPCQVAEPERFRHSEKSKKLISDKIKVLKQKGVLETAPECDGQYISNLFIRPKPNGKVRMIIDLLDLKTVLEYQHFKMESLQTVVDLCVPGCFMGSLDLSDAYYSVPIHKDDRNFLKFWW